MSGTTTELIADLRIDLKDPDDERWSDAVLTRHIQKAVQEYSQLCPLLKTTNITADASGATLSLATLPDESVIRVIALECPRDSVPQSWVPFTWQGLDTIVRMDGSEFSAENCRVHWLGPHEVDSDSSTVYEGDDEVILAGAFEFALIEYANYNIDQFSFGAEDADSEYYRQSSGRRRRFRQLLREAQRRLLNRWPLQGLPSFGVPEFPH